MRFSIVTICVHVYTISMKISDLPEYAERYKKKGFDVKKKIIPITSMKSHISKSQIRNVQQLNIFMLAK